MLREEVDLLEVELAEVVLAYLDHLEARGELDLETATEFLVLIAALLELKSRLMLPGEERRAARHSSPAEAAEELLERMLECAPLPRARPTHLRELLAREHGVPLPQRAAAALAAPRPSPPPRRVYDPDVLGAALGGLLRDAAADRPRATWRCRGSRSPSAWRTCARCCAAARFSFDEAVRGADRVTVAVTLFALLELYKRGEADVGARTSRSARSPIARAGARRRSARVTARR